MIGVRPAVRVGLFIVLSIAFLHAQTTVSPTSLNFGSMTLGNSTNSASVVLKNTGTKAVTSIVGSTTNDYSQTNNCPASLAPKASCTFSVKFRPTVLGTDTGSLTIASSSISSPQTVGLSGTGVIPTTVTPGSINFGSVTVGSTSAATTVTLKNNQNISLTGIVISTSADFSQTNNCSTSLGAGASCKINVTYSPTVGGARTGQLTISHSAFNSPDLVALSGNGVGATLGISPSSIVFGSQLQGTVSAAQNFNVTNTGSVPVSLSSIAVSGEFRQTNNCPASLAVGSSCSVAVTFAPQSAGTKSGTLTISDNATGSPQMLSLSGTGTSMLIGVSPTMLTFGNQLQHTTSTAQSVTVTNTGTAAVSLSSVTVTGEFTQTNNCPATLNVGASCAVSVAFAPQSAGSKTGTLIINDNANGGPHAIPLSGTGTSMTISVSPAVVAFGNQMQTTTSAAQSVTLSNTGTQAIAISGISVSGEFTQTNNCPSSLNSGANCAISVVFAPQSTGSKQGTLTISDNADGAPHTVALSGTGTSMVLSLSPASVSFGDQLQNTSSSAQAVTITNTGTLAVAISSVTISGEFTQTNNCPASLSSGASCVASVDFAPVSAGAKSGALIINDNATGGPHTVALSGSGTSMTLSVSPASLSFGTQLQNTSSVAQNVTITNTGTLVVAISNVAISGEFTQTNNCPSSLAVGASCTASVVFAPVSSGSKSGMLTINDNASGGPHAVSLSGVGASKSLSVSPITVNFGNQPTNTTSAAQSVAITNTGTLDLSIASLQTNGTFAQTNNCPATLVAGSSCTANVTFTPAVMGSQSGSLVVYDNAINGPHTVALSGTGTTMALSFSPNAIVFGNQLVNTSSIGRTLTISNSGNLPVSISGITSTGAFAQTNTCPASLAVSTSCTVTVTFNPISTGSQAGTININDNATGGPHSISLSGTGTSMALSISPTALSFGDELINTTGAGQTVIISNTGTLPVSISSITTTAGFVQSNNCPASLASGSSCAVTVSFSPATTGAQNGTLTIGDNATGAPHTVSLNGNGTSLTLSISPASLSFGDELVNTSGAAQPLTITNTGTLPVSISGISTTTGFTQSNTCPASLPSGASCIVAVSFSPTSTGWQSGNININDNATGGPHTISLSGNATSLSAAVSSSNVTFADQTQGTTSAAQAVTFTNTGTLNVNITGISTTGDFGQSNNCPASLSGGMSCTLLATFSPRSAGALSGSIVINDNAGSHTIALSGNGVGSVAQPIIISPVGARLLLGSSQTFTATQLLSDGTTQDVTAQATWTSSDPSLVSFSGNSATALSPGTVTITAQVDSLSGSATVIAKTAGSADTSPMHFARSDHGAIPLADGKVLIAGGQDQNGNFIAQAEIFDPATMNFQLTGTMNHPRATFAAVALQDGRVLVAGGASSGGTESTIEIYDPATGQFSPTASLYNPASSPSAVTLNDGRVLITSGSDAELYDPSSGNVNVVGPMEVNRAQHTLTLLQDGRVLVVGGDQWPATTSTAEIFDPQTLTFTFTGGLPVLRNDHTATLLKDGRVLIAGGYGSGLLETDTYVYDPSSGTFSPTGSLTTSRYEHRAILLPDGRVMIGGGLAWFFDTASVEIYDPATGQFTLSKEMNARRGSGTATLLSTGEVLFTGGMNYDPGVSFIMAPLNTAELYSGTTTLSSVTITPANPTLSGTQNIEFQFTGTFADGSTQDLSDIGSWTCDNPNVLYLNQYSGMANGNGVSGETTVTGQLGQLSATTTVSVQ